MAPETRSDETSPLGALVAAARERILILDGAMGTQIQGLGLDEDALPRRPVPAAATATSRATTTS